MRYKLIAIFLLCFSLQFQLCEAKPNDKLIQKANGFFERKDFINALDIYLKLYEKDTLLREVAFNIGICYFELNKPQSAINFFAICAKDNKYEKQNEAMFYAGKSHKLNGNYKEAKKYFEKAFKKYRKKNKEMEDKCKDEIELCDKLLLFFKANDKKKVYSELTEIKLPDTLKSCYNAILIDSVLSFSSMSVKQQNFRFQYSLNNTRIYNENLTEILSILPKGQMLTFLNVVDKQKLLANLKDTAINGFTKMVWILQQSDNSWKVEYFNEKINNNNSNQLHPCFYTENQTENIIFSSDRMGGIGGYDLYKIQRLKGTSDFSEPENLGEIINSKGDEITPHYCEQCKILFFSSNGHIGMGGFDVFKTDFTKINNLMTPVNSAANDLYFQSGKNDIEYYFASNRAYVNGEAEVSCCNKIYYRKNSELKIPDTLSTAMDTKTSELNIKKNILKELPSLNLYFDNDYPNPKSKDTSTTENIFFLTENYLKKKDVFTSKFSSKSIDDKKQLELLETFFTDSVEGNLSELNSYLDKLTELLQLDVKVHLEVKGFCSNLAENSYNRNLAKRRIKSLINYISQYNNKTLSTYLNNGTLSIKELSIGEIGEESTGKFDAKKDIYSFESSVKRKIQIKRLFAE